MARIGLLSDSHGRAATTQAAVRLLIDAGAQLLLHMGDVGDEQVIDSMVEQLDDQSSPNPPVRMVFGNTDWNPKPLARYASDMGVTVDDPVGRFEIDGKKIVFTHGHIEDPMRQAVAEGVDYLFHGHTHQQRDDRIGQTRVINPGALFRAAQHTVAMLDTEQDQLTFYTVPGN